MWPFAKHKSDDSPARRPLPPARPARVRAAAAGSGAGAGKAKPAAAPGVAAVEAVQTAFDPQRFFRDAEEQGLKLVSGDEKNPLVLRGEPREMMALFSDGTILVSESHLHTPSVDSYISRARRSYQLRRQPVSLEVIGEAYRRLGAVSDKRRATGARTPRQAEAVSLIREAIEMDATDIHINVKRDGCTVELRVDGLKQAHKRWTVEQGSEFCRAFYMMCDDSDKDYNESFVQPGRLSRLKWPDIDDRFEALRLQCSPLNFRGRMVVARILYSGKDDKTPGIEGLGYSPEHLAEFERMRQNAEGIVIFAGPTGHGKSTSMARNLARQIEEHRNTKTTLTVEDPPERDIPGASQIPVLNATTQDERREKFQEAINAALRSDPDVMMIGEIRDRTSAQLAFEGAMTGHQIWTTVHANDALKILLRLLDIGVEGFKLFDESTVTGLINQRLVRRLCPHCSMPIGDAMSEKIISGPILQRLQAGFDLSNTKLRWHGRGCSHCRNRGYIGREVVAEVLAPDATIMMHMKEANRHAALQHWLKGLGGSTMFDHARGKVNDGLIDLAELERVLGPVPGYLAINGG